MKGLRKTTSNSSQDSRCLGGDSNRAPPEYKPEALPWHRPRSYPVSSTEHTYPGDDETGAGVRAPHNSDPPRDVGWWPAEGYTKNMGFSAPSSSAHLGACTNASRVYLSQVTASTRRKRVDCKPLRIHCNQLHGAEPFLRRWRYLNYSRNSQHSRNPRVNFRVQSTPSHPTFLDRF
jgi:hypothetical protein